MGMEYLIALTSIRIMTVSPTWLNGNQKTCQFRCLHAMKIVTAGTMLLIPKQEEFITNKQILTWMECLTTLILIRTTMGLVILWKRLISGTIKILP